MGAGELHLYLNNKLWQLEWCRHDHFESQQILREIEYAIGSLKMS